MKRIYFHTIQQQWIYNVLYDVECMYVCIFVVYMDDDDGDGG